MEPLLAIAGIVMVDGLEKSPDELAGIVTKLQGWPVSHLVMRVETVACEATQGTRLQPVPGSTIDR
jgi:hypothetical protein